MRQATPLILGLLFIFVGCASHRHVDPDAMVGRPLAEVVKAQQLDQYEADPWINLPPDGPQVTTYYLPAGNLELWYTGDPPIVTKALYLPSDKSIAERLHQRNVEYSKWLESRRSK